MHLIIDGYGGDTDKMWDTHLLTRFLTDYPSVLGMTTLCQPKVLRYDAPKVEDSGITGFVIIAESHISAHTFPNRNFISIDVYSCKSFDKDRALRDIKELFSLGEVKTWVLDRGLEHLDEIEASSARLAARSSDNPL